MTDDELAVAEAVADMIPRVAALSGWRNVNRRTIQGLLDRERERRGLSVPGERAEEVHAETLRLAFPHVVELGDGLWYGGSADFVRSSVLGMCSLSLALRTDEESEHGITRYRVWFTERAEAALFRLTFG